MSKTLSESAAEILKASMNAGKEPAQALPAEKDDLGGQTPTQLPDAIGAKAAANISPAAKPAVKGDAKSAKTQAMEETEVDETSEVVAEESTEETVEEAALKGTAAKPLLKPGQKIGAMKMEGEEVSDEDYLDEAKAEKEEEDEEEDEEDEKEMKEAYKNDMKKKHAKSMAEDVDALFNGESLSEEFKTKATTIFEAAVNSRVDAILEDMITENDAILSEAVEALKEEMSSQVDEYLNYVVEQWMEDNAVAIETGLRSELSEDFINGLKNLFAEHYIEIPEEKVNVAEELAGRVAELEEIVESLSTTAEAEINSLVEELNAAKRNEAIRKICEGLTEVQVGKMVSLAEGVEFTTEGEFNEKLAVIRENYFPSKTSVKSEVKALQETTVSEDQPEVAEVHGLMKHYVKAISKTAPKA
jgi:hypothetical protein